MKLRKSTPFLAATFATTMFCHFAASSASAQALYWDNNGATAGFGTASGTWAAPTIGNATQGWSTDTTGSTLPVNVTTAATDTLNFGNAGTGLTSGAIAVTGTVSANSLIFATGSGAVTISGGTIATTSLNFRSTGHVIKSAISLNANGTIAFSRNTTNTGQVDLDGQISGNFNLNFTTPSTSPATNSGGSLQIIQLGSANTYTGNTSITTANSNNTLNVKATVDNALPTTTVLTLDGGDGPTSATAFRTVAYDLNGKNQTLAGLDNNKTRNAQRLQRIISGPSTPTTLTINNASPASPIFSGNINATAISLVKTGTGTQTLGAANTYAGDTTISGGKLQWIVGGNCANSKVIINNVSATLAISVTDNTKTWTCKELATTAAGTIEFNFGSVTPSTSLSPLTITAPGLADFITSPQVVVNTDTGLVPGTYPLMTWDSASGTIPTTVSVPNMLPFTAASLIVSGNTLNLTITSTSPTVVKANNTNNLSGGNSWVGGIAPDSTKTAVWNSTVTSPNTTVLGANLAWGGISIVNPNGLVTIGGTNTLTLGNAAIHIDMSAATADLTLNCPLALGADNSWNINTSRTLTLGGQVSGAFPIDKLGSGTAVLSSSANSYSGDTLVSAGTLKLGASNVVPDGIGNGNVSVTGALDLNGKNETINGLSGSGIIDNSLAATSSTLSVGANDQSSTFNGILQNSVGTLNLTKVDTGLLVLGGANTLSGNVSVNSGTLAFSNISPFDNASGIVMTGGTRLRPDVGGNNLTVVAPPITVGATGTTTTITAPNAPANGTTAVTVTLASPISGSGNVTFLGLNSSNSYGTVFLNAQSNYAGTTLMTCSNEFATPSTQGNNNIFVRLGVTNALPVTTELTLDGGAGAGTGRFCELNLAGFNQTLAGLTNVSGNSLRSQEIYNSSATTSTLTVNNTAPYIFSGRIGGQIGASATAADNLGLTKSGTGTFTISGPNSYTSATTISGGTLALGALNTLPNASAVSIGNATLNAATAGTETAGTLAITGAATISLAPSAQLIFADSSASGTATWAGTLNITGFVSGSSLNFGSSSGLTAQQLSKISATGFTNFALDAEGDLIATPVGGNTFANWLATNAPATGFITDTDKDGLANGVENVLGSNPNAYNAGLTAISSTASSVTFKHTLNPTIASDVTYGYQWSTDLTEWKTTGQTNTSGITATIAPSAPVLGTVTVTITITGGTQTKLFGRLVANN